jgi:hypothetical protein
MLGAAGGLGARSVVARGDGGMYAVRGGGRTLNANRTAPTTRSAPTTTAMRKPRCGRRRGRSSNPGTDICGFPLDELS